MIPIQEFPYGNDVSPRNLMHKKLLLLEMVSRVGSKYAVGYYNAAEDTFQVCQSPFIGDAIDSKDERPIDGIDCYCVIPPAFTFTMGPRRISRFMPMYDVMDIIIQEEGLVKGNITDVLQKAGFDDTYLVCVKNGRRDDIIVSQVGYFSEKGKQFTASGPVNVNGNTYHMLGPIPEEKIRWVVSMDRFYQMGAEKPADKKRMVDADELFSEICGCDLAYMSQDDVTSSIRDVIKRQIAAHEGGVPG